MIRDEWKGQRGKKGTVKEWANQREQERGKE